MYDVASAYQAWLPTAPFLPTQDFSSQSPGLTPQGSGSSTDVYGPKWLQAVLQSWVPPDPLPTLAPKRIFAAGGSFTVYSPTWFPGVYQAWVPPDPLPQLPNVYNDGYAQSGPPIPNPIPPPTLGGGYVPRNVLFNGAIPVFPVINTPTGAVTPRAGLRSVVSGGGAVIAVTGPINGGLLINPINASAQGVTAEDLYLDMVSPPGSTDATGNGTTILLSSTPPGNTFAIPALSAGVNLWVNAGTPGHKFSLLVW